MLPALADLVDLLLPVECVGCAAPSHRWCPDCRRRLVADVVGFGGPRWVQPDPCPVGFPPTVSAAAYEGVLAAAVRAHKDEDRRDLRPLLGEVLAGAVGVAVRAVRGGRGRAGTADDAPVLLIAVPSSKASTRARGRDPLGAVVAHAGARWRAEPVRVLPALRQVRRVRDQAGLTAAARRVNLAGAVGVTGRAAPEVVGSRCVLVDDVVTTGASLTAAAGALWAAGAVEVVAATICARERRHPSGNLSAPPMVPLSLGGPVG